MCVQKCYIWYCVATWSLWCIAILLAVVTGGPYNVQNASVYQFVLTLSRISFVSALIPVHPILFVICLCYSIKHKYENDTVFNICSILFTSLLAVFVMAFYAFMIGA